MTSYSDVSLMIDGAWTKGAKGRTIPVINPATEEVIGTVAHAETADLDRALAAAEKGHALRPSDLFINTTLSRIWMERGDKARAEHFGAQAKIADWKEQLKNPPAPDAGGLY